jgi:hypothetical protein
VVIITPSCQLSGSLDGPQTSSVWFGEENNLTCQLSIILRFLSYPICSIVLPTELFWLLSLSLNVQFSRYDIRSHCVQFLPLHFFTVPCSSLLLSRSLYTVAALLRLLSHPTALFGLPLFQETTKPVLKVPDTHAAVMACRTLLCCLDAALRALSPFMPFVTEELYHHLPHFKDHCCSESIMVAPYPTDLQVWLSGLRFYHWCG